jgi:hypothetical protein
MFTQEVTLFRFVHGYLQKLIADMDDRNLTNAAPGAVNPPAYVIGHLAIANDFALQLLGQPNVCPESWHEAFGPGSSPDRMKIGYPPKQELLEKVRLGHERVCAAAMAASADAMSKPQPLPFLKDTPIMTVGDLVAHLMTTHFAVHVGQLSLMRRQQGRPPLF